jgi:hypothetical protein
MKNSVWFFALEKRKLVLKKYPAKKSKGRKLKIPNPSKSTHSSNKKKNKKSRKK